MGNSSATELPPVFTRLFGSARSPAAATGAAAAKPFRLSALERDTAESLIGEKIARLHVTRRELDARALQYARAAAEYKRRGELPQAKETLKIKHNLDKAITSCLRNIGVFENLSLQIVQGDISLELVELQRGVLALLERNRAQMGSARDLASLTERYERTIEDVVEAVDLIEMSTVGAAALPMADKQLEEELEELALRYNDDAAEAVADKASGAGGPLRNVARAAPLSATPARSASRGAAPDARTVLME